MEVKKAFGEIIRELRKEKKLSQEDLAELATLDRTFISIMETGKRQPSLSTIFLLAKALDVAPATIVTRVNKLTTKVGNLDY